MRALSEAFLPVAVLSPSLGWWAASGAVDDRHSQFLLADAVGRETALLHLQERAAAEHPLEEGAPT
eukprot:5294291-Alexandrium_andersonii.AAC.1